MEPFHTELLVVPELVHLEVGPTRNQTKKFSCKLPEPFLSGMLRNKARGNLNEDSW